MTVPVSDAWYEVVEGGTLEQGDLLIRYPVFVPTSLSFPFVENEGVDIDVQYLDVVVLTQSCDMGNNKVPDIVLCAHFDFETAKRLDPVLAKKDALPEIQKGRRPRYNLLNRSDLLNPPLGLRIVDCGKVFSLPFPFVQALAAYQGPRLRLRSPYREHLSQAFARFFMRVGLPQDIQL